MRVLLAEDAGQPGATLLRESGHDIVDGKGWTREQLLERVGEFDGVVIRSGTKVDAELLSRAGRLKIVARAGVGVDNVDVDAATRAGVVVANAPASNVVTAAEHTMALLLALARNVPQAHASLTGGHWERSKFAGVELQDKVLGVLGFGRIGQLVAQRARGFGMKVVAYDVFIAEDRFRELGVERAKSADDIYAIADFITVHLPKTSDTENFLDAAAFAKMKDGVRVLNVARGPLLVDEALQAALDSGKVAGAALDVWRSEPVTDHPLFGYPNVVVTPHLGASTAEATDRAGLHAAEQVVAALSGAPVTAAVNLPAIGVDDLEAVGPFLALSSSLGRIAAALAPGSSLDGIEVECLGRLAERDSRLLTIQVVKGVLGGSVEEPINDVNALTVARERGIDVSESRQTQALDFTDLVRVRLRSGEDATRVVGTVVGRRNRPHLLEAWGSRFNVQLDPYLAIFRYEDQPGMLGRVGLALGDAGVNIISASVGRRAHSEADGHPGEAIMLVTTEAKVPAQVVADIVNSDGFIDGRTVAV